MSLLARAGQGDLNALNELRKQRLWHIETDSRHRNLISIAAEQGQVGVVELILAECNPNSTAPGKRTPLSFAAENGHIAVVGTLLHDPRVDPDYADSRKQSPLSFAAENGHEEVVKRLLDEAVEVNSRNDTGWTPLSFAAQHGHAEVVRQLLGDSRVEADSKDEEGRTPLSFAAQHGHEEVVRQLLSDSRVEADTQDEEGRTPLSFAAQHGHEEVVRQLLGDSRVEADSKDKEGRTPLSFAIIENHSQVVKLLLAKSRGSSIPDTALPNDQLLAWTAADGDDSSVSAILVKNAVDPNYEDCDKRTPLSLAAENGHQKVVELLLCEETVDPIAKDNRGNTPLWWASRKRHMEVVKLLNKRDQVTLLKLVQDQDYEGVQLLLSSGHDIEAARDSLGRTSLHVAISIHDPKMVELLAVSNIINVTDSDGETPLRLAIRLWGSAIVRLQRPDFVETIIEALLKHSAKTTDVNVDDWRKVCGDNTSDIIKLSGGPEGGVELISKDEPIELKSFLVRNQNRRHLFMVSTDDVLHSSLFLGQEIELAPYVLKWTMKRGNDNQSDHIALAIQFPAEQNMKQEVDKEQYWKNCRVSWTMEFTSNSNSNRNWTSVQHFSTMPYGELPNTGVDFFKQFITYITKRWLKLCDRSEDDSSKLRITQLDKEGKSPKLISDLAKEAKKLAELRTSLQGQAREAEKFVLQYRQWYGGNHVELQEIVVRFESTIRDKIMQLEQTVRDLSQLELAWASMTETRDSVRLGKNVMLLTYVSIFYLPLSFCAALWAIPDITHSATRSPFIITSILVALLTLLITFNLEVIFNFYCKQKTSIFERWNKSKKGDEESA